MKNALTLSNYVFSTRNTNEFYDSIIKHNINDRFVHHFHLLNLKIVYEYTPKNAVNILNSRNIAQKKGQIGVNLHRK